MKKKNLYVTIIAIFIVVVFFNIIRNLNGFSEGFGFFGVFALLIPILFSSPIIIIIIIAVIFSKRNQRMNDETHDSRHFDDFSDTAVKAEDYKFVHCEYCGTKNNRNQIKCTGCGASVKEKNNKD